MNATGAGNPVTRRPYQHLSLVELVKRIVNDRDRRALDEIHNRAIFRSRPNGRTLLTAFVAELAQSNRAFQHCGCNQAALDQAYDLTISKFLFLPEERVNGTAGGRRGIDCRCYYRALLTLITQWRMNHPTAGPLDEEIQAEYLLGRLVQHQFRQSCREVARRNDPTRSRYRWRIGDEAVCLWMPVALLSRERRAWLEQHIEKPELSRPGERQRIQARIDSCFGVARHVPLGRDLALFKPAPTHTRLEQDIAARGLRMVIAEEKATNIHALRPRIAALGPQKLMEMILRVFGDLEAESYDQRTVAHGYHLSTATMSRFAGSHREITPKSRPADLWLNVARTVAAHPRFAEAAQEAGLWKRIEWLLHEWGEVTP